MTRDELIKMAERYDARAAKAYYNYQASGMPRYDREMRNAEDLAEALRMAASASEDHMKLQNLRAELRDVAYRVDNTPADNQRTLAVLSDIVSLAEIFCGYKRKEQI